MILILGGTREGRLLSERLAEAGLPVVNSTATQYGATLLGGVPAISGRLDKTAFARLIGAKRVRAVVDATHPFAERVTANAISVCAEYGLAYLRYERPPADIPEHRSVLKAASPAEAAGLALISRRVFLSTGVKSLGCFIEAAGNLDPDIRPDFFVRILPCVESMTAALKWVPAANILAAQGPFDYEFNKACFTRFAVDTLVTKDSGAGVGVEEKIGAALDMGLKIIVINRPKPPSDAVHDFDRLAFRLRALYAESG